MLIEKFALASGFKVLAMARLSQIEYSIVLYLINCAASNLSEVITTDAELSSLVGYEEDEIRKAIEDLFNRNIIRIKYGASHSNPDIDSLSIGMQFDTRRWHLDFLEDATSKDAVVFPFRRAGEPALQAISSTEEKVEEKDRPTWVRVFESFIRDRSLDEEELAATEATSRVLVDTHPVDQVLLMIRHFSGRIPTLSLLASSWQHYQELFEDETQKVDMMGARQKHQEQDKMLRDAAHEFLFSTDADEYSQEERTVLEILSKHRHPRRQLFWAYQMRTRYPNLSAFFEKTHELMLSVTSAGKVVTRKGFPVDD